MVWYRICTGIEFAICTVVFTTEVVRNETRFVSLLYAICMSVSGTDRGSKTTPKWAMKAPPTSVLAIFDPRGGFTPLRGGLNPSFGSVGLSRHRGGLIFAKGWFYPPKGEVSSRTGSFWGGGGACRFGIVLSSVISSFIPPLGGWRGGMARLYVILEPQYWNKSSGMEVPEVMEGDGTAYGFTFRVSLLFVFVHVL